jgi:hypothetical protein
MLLALLLVAGCRNRTPPLPAVGEQAVLSCSRTCSERGQCGTIVIDQPVVLANVAGPAVKFQDIFFTDGALVTVIETNDRELIAASNGVPLTDVATPFPHTFFRVQDEAGKNGWVSSWCVARP